MTSPENTKSARGRELSAVMFNLKEQRVLEKCLQKLQLQQTYSLKILDIGNREVKVHYKKLKDKVSKIKSYLTVEDISKFRELESQGKLRPSSDSVVTSSSLKMAEASRRLNLFSDRSSRRAIRSALPRISTQTETSHLRRKSSNYPPNSPGVDFIKRSKSFTDAQQTFTQPPQIVLIPQRPCEPKRQNFILELNNEDLICATETVLPQSGVKQESLAVPETYSMMETGEKHGHNFRSHSATGEKHAHNFRSHSAYCHSHSPFSSHVAAAKDARADLSTAPAQYNNMQRLSLVSHDSIDSNLGENLFEERRLEMLEEENLKAASLDKKTQDFLRKVDDYLQREPRLQSARTRAGHLLPESTPGNQRSYSRGNNQQHQRFHRRDQFLELDGTPTSFPEQDYKERLATLWKDMNKCRYLRISDDKLDLSGINTLAKDNMHLFDVFRQSERAPLSDAWE